MFNFSLKHAIIEKNTPFAMELKSLSQRALQIREQYASLEEKKFGKSWTNAQIAQGLVGDVGDLMKLIMAKDGVRDAENVDEKLSHELSDCLWVILVLASKYNIDIETSFLKTMDELELRIASTK